jgi:hypothetical protein
MDRTIEPTSKFILCVLLTQLGKTFTAISKINAEIIQDNELGRSIHIIFTMNTLLNNKQFAKRLETTEKTYGKGSVCVFSSKYDGNYKHLKNRLELQGLCADGSTCPRVVVMCSNSIRYDDGLEFLKVIDKNKINIIRAFAYYDELHNYINDTLRSQIEQIDNLDIVKGITALTASPDKIWQDTGFWSKIKLIQLEDFSDTNYVGYKDMVFNCIDDFFTTPYMRPSGFDEMDSHTIGFIDHVLRKHPEILGDNTRSFIPAHIRRTGHNSVRDLIFSINKNAIVIVINGFEKTLQYNDCVGNKKTLALTSEDEELCETISRLVIHHKIQNRPIVITGLLCIGMGQTLTHKSLGSFTSAIFGHLDLTNDEIYQLFGRITGRMKDWGDKYIQSQVYCPTIIMNRCIVMEECARNMAYDHNGEVVTQDDYREPMTELGEAGQSAIENIRIPKKTKGKGRGTFTSVDDIRITVPIVIKITPEQFASIKNVRWNFNNLFECIDPELRAELKRICEKPVDHECPSPTKPGYEKKITTYIKASNEKKKIKAWASEISKNPTKDNYVIYLDQVNHHIIVSIYYGSRSQNSS